jgi:AcrR family transcriptional regulator
MNESVTRRDPVQRRSRERVEQILAAAEELVLDGDVDELSTRSVAERSGVPVPTVYRYFANADAIFAALLDREMELMDDATARAVLALDVMTLRTLVETTVMSRLRHHQERAFTVTLWFGVGQASAFVRERLAQKDQQVARWLDAAGRAAGFVSEEAPDFGAEMLMALADRMYEFVLMNDRPRAEQDHMAMEFVEMVSAQLERYAEPAGRDGIPTPEFLRLLAKNTSQVTPGRFGT